MLKKLWKSRFLVLKLVDESGEQDIIHEFWYQSNLHWNPEICIKYVFDPDWLLINEKNRSEKIDQSAVGHHFTNYILSNSKQSNTYIFFMKPHIKKKS